MQIWSTTLRVLFACFILSLSAVGQQPDAPGKTPSENSHEKNTKSALPHYRVKAVAPPVVEGNSTDSYGSFVTSVSDAQIADLNAQDLSTALRRIPGVSISRYNTIGSYGGADGGAVYVRGQGSGRPGAELSILVDGVPRFVGVWTHPLLDTINVDQIRRIDVYKSPQPVLLGNMSFAAVNVVPRTTEIQGFSGTYGAAYGGYDTVLQRIQVNGGRSWFDFALNGSYRRSEGHRENSSGQTWALDGTFGIRLGTNWRINSYLSHADGWAEDPGIIGAPATGVVPRFATNDDFFLVDASHDYGRWSGSVKLYYENGLIDWLQWDRDATSSFRTVTGYDNYGIRAREKFRPWENGEVLFGFDQDFYGGDAAERWDSGLRNPIDLSFRNTSPYLMVSQSVELGSFRLTPSGGVRLNSSRFFGDVWGPQAGLTLDRGDTRLYGNYANGFNLPGVYAASFYAGWGRGDQWKTLRPERIHHVEAGILHSLASGMRLSWSVYRDHVEDALRFLPPPPPPPQFNNIGDYRIVGSELTLDFFIRDDLAVFTGANYQNSRPSDVPNSPRWTWVSGLNYLLGRRLRLNADAEWVDRQFVLNPRFAVSQQAVGAYFLLNGRCAYRLGRRRELFVAVENVMNSDYEFRPGYPMPGRTWTIGLNLGLGAQGN